jgi:GNAT superfamily N-acetyltransferase
MDTVLDSRTLIRTAARSDVPGILQLIRELAEYEKLSHAVSARERDLENMLFGPRPYAEVLLAEEDGELAGFCLFFHNFSTFLARPGIYLEDMFVRPICRDRGIGKMFFAELARLAHERGCGRIEWSVLDWNEPAIGFYKKLGAEELKEWRIYRLTEDTFKNL